MASRGGTLHSKEGPWVLVYVKADSSVSLQRREIVRSELTA